MTRPHRHRHYMARALSLAEQAAKLEEVPVGAVVVDPEGQIIGEGYNRRIIDHDPVAHAEILALREAAAHRGSWRLDGCKLYVTLEPCPMCAGALVNARVAELVYGCDDGKAGAIRSLYALCEDPRLNHRLAVTRGVESDRAKALLQAFFARLRIEGQESGGGVLTKPQPPTMLLRRLGTSAADPSRGELAELVEGA